MSSPTDEQPTPKRPAGARDALRSRANLGRPPAPPAAPTSGGGGAPRAAAFTDRARAGRAAAELERAESGFAPPSGLGYTPTMNREEAYTDLLNRRDYLALEALASDALAREGGELAALMVAHARIRRGLFAGAADALHALERAAPQRRQFVQHIVAMCEREREQGAGEPAPSERERVNGSDLWLSRRADAPVAGQATLRDGRAADFADLEDADPHVGRRLLAYALDRAWRIPFDAIASLKLEPLSALRFDDLWTPVTIVLRPGEPLQHVNARVPALYPRSLDHPDPQIASGRRTGAGRGPGGAVPVGQRDYRLSFPRGPELVGILALKSLNFRPA